MEQLTICIPTYNRKERLLNQLESLYRQKEVKDVKILIIDNHSDYDVLAAIEDHFGKEKIENLDYYSNEVNLGLEPNICMPFFLARTKWIWTLSDDDETTVNSIKNVLKTIESNPNVSSIIFSIEGKVPHKNIIFDDITKFIHYWDCKKHQGGELVFYSNKVYNLELCKHYLGQTIKQCYNCVGHIVPILLSLNDKAAKVMVKDVSIIKYMQPASGTGWNYTIIALEFTLISHMILNVEKKSWQHFRKVIGSGIDNFSLMKHCLSYSPRYMGLYIYREVYKKLLCLQGYKNTIFFLFFYFCWFTHIKPKFLDKH